jgi:hypothetical protein
MFEYASSCCIPTTWIKLPLVHFEPYNDDTSIFSFGLPNNATHLNLPTCACLLLLAPDVEHGGGDAIRPYTPISSRRCEGRFDLLVKRYDEWGDKPKEDTIFSFFSYNQNPHSYKPKGAVSNYIFSLTIGSEVMVCIITIIFSTYSKY